MEQKYAQTTSKLSFREKTGKEVLREKLEQSALGELTVSSNNTQIGKPLRVLKEKYSKLLAQYKSLLEEKKFAARESKATREQEEIFTVYRMFGRTSHTIRTS